MASVSYRYVSRELNVEPDELFYAAVTNITNGQKAKENREVCTGGQRTFPTIVHQSVRVLHRPCARFVSRNARNFVRYFAQLFWFWGCSDT